MPRKWGSWEFDMYRDSIAHVPVMLQEVLAGLNLKSGTNVFDGTVGLGGHAKTILNITSPNGRLLGLDLDETALDSARKTLENFGSRAMLVYENYSNIGKVVLNFSFGSVQAALLDLGFSSLEIDDPARGFSFRFSGPLDMRYDARQELTAAHIVNMWSEAQIADILHEYGEEKFAYLIARAIIMKRSEERIVDTQTLAELIAGIPQLRRGHYKINPATRTFQALRIAVNHELENVKLGIASLMSIVESGGRIAIISFHSLEDRIVKRVFAKFIADGYAKPITKKPIIPSDEEIERNPRARSAKLRIIEVIKNI